MNKEGSKIWIVKGYELFAIYGFKGLKVETISREVGKKKSSFYHYFVDMDNFMNY